MQLAILTSATGSFYLDLSPLLVSCKFGTNEHGFGALTATARTSLWESFQIYDRPGLPHLALTHNGIVTWEGRLEDVKIINGGVELSAFGYWSAMSDIPLPSATYSGVSGSTIISALLTYAPLLSTNTTLISNPGNTLYEDYSDKYPSEIAARVAGLGDSANAIWEVGVWENRLLHFRARGAIGKSWYVDVSALEVERTIAQLYNSVYAVYQDATGRYQRTATTTDAASIARYGLTRQVAASAQARNSAQAVVFRDSILADWKDPIPRAGIMFDRVFDAGGAQWPLWMVRSGDTITIRNLPPTLSTSVDRIRTFRIKETEYDVIANTLSVVPESRLPSLAWGAGTGLSRPGDATNPGATIQPSPVANQFQYNTLPAEQALTVISGYTLITGDMTVLGDVTVESGGEWIVT